MAFSALPLLVLATLNSLLIVLPYVARIAFKRVTVPAVIGILGIGLVLDLTFHLSFPYHLLWLGLFVIAVRNIEEYVDFHHPLTPLLLGSCAFLWTIGFDAASRLLVARDWNWNWQWKQWPLLTACAYALWYVTGGTAARVAQPGPGNKP
ncbi:MAG: hypothetical protein ACREJQ_08390 [bacterium]